MGRRADGGGDGTGGSGGTGVVDGGTSDAEDAPVTGDDGGVVCSPSKPFAAPLIVPGLNQLGTNSTARLTPDELTAYFGNLRARRPADLRPRADSAAPPSPGRTPWPASTALPPPTTTLR